MPGAPDWSGVRLNHGTEQLLNVEVDNLAPGASHVHTVPVVRPGYIVELHAWNATDNVTKLPFQVYLNWQDGVSGDGLDRQAYNAYAGTQVGPHYIDGSGPTKGGQLTLTVTNLTSSGPSLSYFLIIDETSFAFPRHIWRTDDIFSFNPTGWNEPNTEVLSNILFAATNYSLAAATTHTVIMPLYTGRVRVHVDADVTTDTQLEIYILAAADPLASGGAIMFDQNLPVTLSSEFDVWLPRSECSFNIQNHKVTGGLTVDYTVIVCDD